MKRLSIPVSTGIAVISIVSACRVFGQGPLTPPGPPEPTFKTLQQVEPRRPISTVPFTINQPGSYYLTRNLTGVAGQNGITIAASGVTLDLMGFELAGVADSLVGVNVSGGQTNIAIRNGTVRNWGGAGVDGNSPPSFNGYYQDLRLSYNAGNGLASGVFGTVIGCTALKNGGSGIVANNGGTVSGCTANTNGDDGIRAANGTTISGCSATGNSDDGIFAFAGSAVSDCSALGNSGDGINASNGSTVRGCSTRLNNGDGISGSGTVVDCAAQANGGHGIRAPDGSTVRGCSANSNTGDGINAGSGSTVSSCSAASNHGDGIEVASDCRVVDNTCDGNGTSTGAGIQVNGSSNRIDSNTVTDNDRGITILGNHNLIIRNSAKDNSPNYDIAPANNVGTIVVAPESPGISGDNGGAGVGSTNPWSNFTLP